MAFMNPDITGKIEWLEIDTDNGTWFVPVDDVGVSPELRKAIEDREWEECEEAETVLQYTEGSRLCNLSLRWGYGARLSAAGYMDCTEWSVYDSAKEAREELQEMYGDDEE